MKSSLAWVAGILLFWGGVGLGRYAEHNTNGEWRKLAEEREQALTAARLEAAQNLQKAKEQEKKLQELDSLLRSLRSAGAEKKPSPDHTDSK